MGVEGTGLRLSASLSMQQKPPLKPQMTTKATEATETEEEEEECKRRTSLPPSFGSTTVLPLEERRWRSFDCVSNASSGSKAAALELLTSRIEQTDQEVAVHKSQLHIRKRDRLRSLFSSRKRDAVQMKQMELMAQVATRKRSLTILKDLKTIVMTLEDDEEASERSSGTSEFSSNQQLLESMTDADQVLRDDIVHYTLECQATWLRKLTALYTDKTTDVTRRRSLGTTAASVLQEFLSEYAAAPCELTKDEPSMALVRFEKLVTRLRLLKPELKKALDRICMDVMTSMTAVSRNQQAQCALLKHRDARHVLQSLVHEVTEAIATEGDVNDTLRGTLRRLVEQMVFGRLACVGFHAIATELDDCNAKWRDQTVHACLLGLDQVGLPSDVLPVAMDERLFAKSIHAFRQMPHLIPSSVLEAFLQAIRVLYAEASELLHVPNGCVSADVLLPLLVFVLSRADLMHLHAQMHLMAEYAIDACDDGSEASYYLACLQAAVGYIMSEEVCA